MQRSLTSAIPVKHLKADKTVSLAVMPSLRHAHAGEEAAERKNGGRKESISNRFYI
jgi:hypothetical protein